MSFLRPAMISKFLSYVAVTWFLSCLSVHAEWARINQSQFLNSDLNEITHGGEQWVGVGERGMIALYDGIGWNELDPVTDHDLNAVAYSDSRFIAVGDNGLILHSQDGSTTQWSVASSNTLENLVSVQYLNGQWVVLGDQGQLVTSPDGVSWDVAYPGSSSSSDRFRCITYFDGEYIALSSPRLWRSSDLVTWTEDSVDTHVSYPIGIEVLNGSLVVWGAYMMIASSADSYLWVQEVRPEQSDHYITDIIYTSGMYFATTSDRFQKENGTIFYSSDLTSWARADGSGRHHIAMDGSVFFADAGKLAEMSTDGIHWSEGKSVWENHAVFSNGQFYTVDRSFLYSSQDGINWARSSLPDGVSGEGLFEANGVFITASDGKVSKSTNLQNWQTVSTTYSKIGKDFLYAFGKYYAIGNDLFGVRVVLKSTDALSWSTIGPEYNLSSEGGSIAYGNGRLVILEDAMNAMSIKISTNGQTPTMYNLFDQPGASGVAFGNGVFVAVSDYADYEIRTSTDGLNWTVRQAPSKLLGGLHEICYVGGRFIARGDSQMLSSTDGVQWKTLSVEIWEADYQYRLDTRQAAYGNGVWFAPGGYAVVTSDFNDYQVVGSVSDQEFVEVQYLHGAFWALAQRAGNISGGTIWRSTDGAHWTVVQRTLFYPSQLIGYGEGVFVIDDTFGNVAFSVDSLDWVTYDSELSRTRTLAVVGNTMYAGQQRGLYKSVDGVSWSRIEAIPDDDVLLIVTSPLGITLVLDDDYRTSIYHSNDGTVWTLAYYSGPTGDLDLVDLLYDGSKLVACNRSGYILQSSDGVTWVQQATPSNIPMARSTVTDNLIYTLHDNGIYVSTKDVPYLFGLMPTVGKISSVAHGNGVSVAVGVDGGIYRQVREPVSNAPASITVSNVGARYLEVSWSDPQEAPAGYVLFYKKKDAEEWKQHSYLSGDTDSVVIEGLEPAEEYQFRMRRIAYDATLSFVDMVGPFPQTLTSRQEWRRGYFNGIENSGDGADNNDFDNDGLENIVEYAFGTNPCMANVLPIEYGVGPSTSMSNYNRITVKYPTDSLRTDIKRSLQYSKDLINWSSSGFSWVGTEPLDDTTSLVTSSLTTNSECVYIRFSVTDN
ncbi:fibronectin type III domain-containing protein [Ruficoccus sp. ZRK36]|uniref:fibronectin type III domain-containing protein n=1 Tax=Ruficoccus sp. ZRK36 TaxID=2866311 RepID=UPI001C73449F|nr:fibronectin type III domain-containing protein [Ruficoccus sp. ZRK36]QYY34999.1 fibronectin type III domain-containing protein [Ruficoccus sp. ZRK36]